MRDVVRLIRRQPGFAFIAVFTTALGITAATILFSLIYNVLLKPLPWPEPDRLVKLSERRQGATRQFPGAVTNAAYLAWADHPATLEALAGFTKDTVTLTWAGGRPERLAIANATPSLFTLLRTRALVGSVFEPGSEREGQPPVVVLSHALWQQRFGSDRSIIGRQVRLDGIATTVIGVMPAGFMFPDAETEAWTPFDVPPVISDTNPEARRLSLFQAMGRLKPGASAAQAAEEGTARGRHAPELKLVGVAVFGSNGPLEMTAVPALEALTADVRRPLLLFFAAVGLLLIAATGNIASLQLARAASRRREMAIRAALGATGARLTGPLLVESLVLGLVGGIVGVVLASAVHAVLPSLLPARFPRLDAISMNGRVAAVAIGLALASAVIFGLAPALLARGLNLVEALTEDSLAPVGAGARTAAARARRWIIIGQVAIASILLVGGLLLARSFVALTQADPGYDAANVLTAMLPLPDASYSGIQRAQLLDRTLERLRALPGVRAAAAGRGLPLISSEQLMAFTMPSGQDSRSGPTEVHAAVRVVSDGWFAALGIKILEGRALSAADTASSRKSVVVNRTFARRYLGDHPIGRALPLGADDDPHPDFEVVGVAEDVHQQSVTDQVQAELFMDYRQLDQGFARATATFVLRTDTSPALYAPMLRELVRAQDDSLALEQVTTMEDRVRNSLAEPRLYAVLLGAFAVCAVIIAGVGLFAVLSYSVTQRAREIGVRAAIGARPVDIVRLVVTQALAMTATGLVIGLCAAAALVRVLSAFLYGVGPYDAVSFAAVAALLGVVAALAAAIPARSAARVDPIRVLRS